MKLLDNFEKYLHDETFVSPLMKVGLIHSQFENIHPFLDGNGRIGRLLITFYLCQQGELQKPLLYLSSYFKKNRQEYYARLHAVHENDDLETWLTFFLKGVIETSIEAVETARKIVRLKEEDVKTVAGFTRISRNAHIVLENLYKSPFITLKHIILWTNLSKSNAYNLLTKLENAGIIKPIGRIKTREKVFYYEKYYKLFS